MDEDKGAPDWRESYVIGPFDHAYDEYHYGPAGWRFFATNVWPDRPAEMRPLWEAYYREMERLAGDIMRIVALALDLQENFFADKIDKHITNFITSYYPPQPTPPMEGQLRCGPHTDYGSITIVSSDTRVGGLTQSFEYDSAYRIGRSLGGVSGTTDYELDDAGKLVLLQRLLREGILQPLHA